MNLESKYKKSLKNKWCLRFETFHPDEDSYNGVVVLNKPHFIVFQDEASFEFDGFIVLPKRIIKGIRDGKFEKCLNEIIRQNQTIEKLSLPDWIASCDTIQQIVTELMTLDIWAGVETIFKNGKDSAFYIGPITKTTDEQFSLKCYDAAGKWEKEYWLEYDEIFRIEFESKYCKYFNAYMQSKD